MGRWLGGVWRTPTVVLVAGGIGLLAFSNAGASSTPLRRSAAAAPHQASGPVSAVIADPGDVSFASDGTFDGTRSAGSGLSYSWDFGDGSPAANGPSVHHRFAAVDDYTVRLSVRDAQGNSDTASRTVRVVPGVDSFTGRPELGQIVPASSFSADLLVNAAGPAKLSVQVGGAWLSSDRWDYQGLSGAMLLEVPDIRVANEDDPGIADQLLSQPGAAIALTDNVGVTLSYAVSSGSSESVSYTVSLLRPQNQLPPRPSGSTTATATPTPQADERVRYQQAAATPPPTPTPTPTPSPSPTASATPAAVAAATATPAPGAQSGSAASAPPATWAITYPNFYPIVGDPVNRDDVDNYYLTGDRQFHAVDSLTVRRWAIKAARAGGVFPNDPQRAADNIYRFVYGLLGTGDPGELQTDLTILGRIRDGVLVPGARSGEYICIAHAYFLSSLTRTLGLPTREETIGFGRAASQDDSGAWTVTYYQEGADEVWYAGAWHHYDTWIGTRDRDDYLSSNLTEVAWYAYSSQSTPFTDVNNNPVGLAGHDFSLGKYAGSPGSPEQWRFLERHTRPGIRIADPGPDAYASESAPPAPRDELVQAGILNPTTGDQGGR